MTHPPAVSVVIATRNYARFLAAAIHSVLGQTYGDLELLIIDDGSTDDTPAVVRPFLADPRVAYHRTDGLGQPRAKNLGLGLARASLIAFLDGDDEWLPEKLLHQLPLFANPSVGVVYACRTLMDSEGRDVPTPPTERFRGRVYDRLLVRNPVCFSSVVIRRQVVEQVGMFDPSLPLAIDYDLWLRAARHWDFDYVDAPLVRYRTGHANLSSRLTERLTAVLGILRRSLFRRGQGEVPDPAAVREAFGSTYRTMGFVSRATSRLAAAGCYLRAGWHDWRWLATARAITAGLLGRR